MDDSHPFHSMSIGHPIPNIRLLQTLILKLRVQGHVCDQRARSYSQPSILSIGFLFISYQSDQQFLRYSYFKIDLDTSKVKVMREVKIQGCILYPVSNWCTSFSFHINRTNNSWDTAKIVFDLEKTHPKYSRKFAKITVSNRTSQKSNQVITMTRAIKPSCFVVIAWVILMNYRADKQIFANRCQSSDLGSRSWKGHPVHFPRLIYSLSQISKI